MGIYFSCGCPDVSPDDEYDQKYQWDFRSVEGPTGEHLSLEGMYLDFALCRIYADGTLGVYFKHNLAGPYRTNPTVWMARNIRVNGLDGNDDEQLARTIARIFFPNNLGRIYVEKDLEYLLLGRVYVRKSDSVYYELGALLRPRAESSVFSREDKTSCPSSVEEDTNPLEEAPSKQEDINPLEEEPSTQAQEESEAGDVQGPNMIEELRIIESSF
jgi:hypothetical protein